MKRCIMCNSLMKNIGQSFICTSQMCGYVDQHPETFTNQVVNGQESTHPQMQRFTFIESQKNMGDVDDFLNSCKKEINNCCFELKYPEIISILALNIIGLAARNCKNQALWDPQTEKRTKEVGNIGKLTQLKIRNTASYSIYVACYQRGFLLEEFKIAKHFRFVDLSSWKKSTEILSQYVFKDLVQNLPPILCPLYLIKKACKSRAIKEHQQALMLQACKRMQAHLVGLGKEKKSANLAALAFWAVCKISQQYKGKFELFQLCRSHESIYSSQVCRLFPETIEKYFDISPECVTTTFKKFFQKDFYQKYLIMESDPQMLTKELKKSPTVKEEILQS